MYQFKTAFLVFTFLIVSCGGGGGSPGINNTVSGTGVVPGTSLTGETQTTTSGSMSLDVLGGSGASSSSLSVLEIAQVKVTLKDAKGVPVQGAVVAFAESVSNLLTIAPASRTALTDANGEASVEIRAVSGTSIGATIISAAAQVSGASLSAQKAIQISSAPPVANGASVSPQLIASAINFLDVNPSDKSIVIQGAGGSGRSESATLRFRVVDKNNTPVKGVVVDFIANPSTNVTLNITTATTDAEGIVVTTVSSRSVATSLVIKAVVNGQNITSQSDQLLVTTGVGVQRGFEIGAEKYNLDGGLSGDSTKVTTRIVDLNGNPVADGVPVVFTTTGGRIGSSSKGGCTTINGKCTVDFEVQDPRNDDIAIITGSTQVGSTLTLAGAFRINMSNPSLSFVDATSLTKVTSINIVNCKDTYTGIVQNARGRSAAAGSVVAVKPITTNFVTAVKSGSPIEDSFSAGFTPLPVTIELDATTIGKCIETGFTTLSASATIEMTTPASKIKSAQNVVVNYPAGKVFLGQAVTGLKQTEYTLGSCDAETKNIRLLTDIPGVAAPLGTKVEASNDVLAVTRVVSGSPVTGSPADFVLSITAPSGGPEACRPSGAVIETSFPLLLAITLNPGQPNETKQIQTVTVKYAKAAP